MKLPDRIFVNRESLFQSQKSHLSVEFVTASEVEYSTVILIMGNQSVCMIIFYSISTRYFVFKIVFYARPCYFLLRGLCHILRTLSNEDGNADGKEH